MKTTLERHDEDVQSALGQEDHEDTSNSLSFSDTFPNEWMWWVRSCAELGSLDSHRF